MHDPANHAGTAVPARLCFTEYRRRPAEAVAPAETGEEQIWAAQPRLMVRQKSAGALTGHSI
ncbi:hypothetical protein ACIRYZ_40790 [Kitasatospora sp. NPDC101155]|uniref:hypothetical protein n=1 Tax=Kitasatospora sp. NPDC101155 TaxID=3364097 RepID=UPI00380D072A